MAAPLAQLPPASAKSPAAAPLMEMVPMFSAALPVLVSVADSGALAWPILAPLKVSVEGASDAAGDAVTFGLPMNAARSAISAAENLPLNRLPMPPLLAANAPEITDG
ncbi:conserved hypothetical protein [Ricinus communis]|uniref:Uncharacterized protein n=1 Tax=Ricinus communis TaxID=3988 RepID=B9TPZ7_RICCO|nr:conserved hypothetical protein [Ricinus communis]